VDSLSCLFLSVLAMESVEMTFSHQFHFEFCHIWPVVTALLCTASELSVPQDLGKTMQLSPCSGFLSPFPEDPQKMLLFRIHLYLLLFFILFVLYRFV